MDALRLLRRPHPWSLSGGRRGASRVILVLHGGASTGCRPTVPVDLAYLRMVDLAAGLRLRARTTAVYLLRHRVQGWNGDGARTPDSVVDACEALSVIADRHHRPPVTLLGHSMGGRTAMAVAGMSDVVGVCALAPWLPEGEPLPGDPAGRSYVIAHGTADTVTSPDASLAYGERLRRSGAPVARLHQTGGGHALMQHAWTWHQFVVATALGLAGEAPLPAGVAADLAAHGSPPRELAAFARR